MDNVISDNQPGMKVVFIICFVVRLNLIHVQRSTQFHNCVSQNGVWKWKAIPEITTLLFFVYKSKDKLLTWYKNSI
jgi:hypothetical protein